MLTRYTVYRDCPLLAPTGSSKVRAASWILHSCDRGRLSCLTHPCTVEREMTRGQDGSFLCFSFSITFSLTAPALMALFSSTRLLCMCFVVVNYYTTMRQQILFFRGYTE